MTNIENNICEAIELIVNKSIYEASYDKTIQGIVQSCEDEAIGKYKIKYQDSTFYAYSTSAEMIYSSGASVYILVPGNDMSKDKTIIGTVDHLGTNYAPQAEGDEAYDIVGTNCILSHNQYQLSSYFKPNQKTTYIKPIYYFDFESQTYKGDVKIDNEGLSTYLKKSKTLICGGHIQTNLAIEQQTRGNYGIIFGLDFLDNTTNKFVTRYYTIDVDNMTGNPYNLKLGKRQYGIFTIDGTNFDRISSISLFVKDFPNQKENSTIEEQQLFDINISDLELIGANPMSQEELNTCGISFETPDGTLFGKGVHDYDKLRIIAKVKVKGKLLNSQVQKLPFYWFQEDVSIKSNSEYYNQYGGRGWRCLNQKNILSEATEESPAVVEWVPATDTYILPFENAKAKNIVLKCVVIYNEVFYSKTITITNATSDIKIKITSDKGIQFYYDMGHPTLTCEVEGVSDISSLKYVWGTEDSYGNFTNLPKDIEKNQQIKKDYQKAIGDLAKLELDIKNGDKFANQEATNLENLKNNISTFDKKEFIENNKFYHVAVNQITDLATYKCSVFDNMDNFLGTGSITLLNSLEMRDGYRLIINNGIQNFQYDEYGMSPTSKTLVKPQIIPALTFTILDDLGRPIDQEGLSQCDILWKIPRKNSMLVLGSTKPDEKEKDKEFYYFKNTLDLAYNIQKKYYYNYKNNDISLEVKYKDKKLIASTDFTFTKIGDAGTNGTEYTCKIVPNTNKIQEDIIPIFTTVENSNIGHFNFTYGTNNSDILGAELSAEAPFKLQLFKSGELIFDDFESGNLLDGKESDLPEVPDVFIEWSFLQNKYKVGVQDESYLTIVKNNDKIKEKISGTMSYHKDSKNTHMAHILKCTVKYKDTTLFATLPIIFVEVKDKKYEIKLKNNTGFQSVIYTSDGVSPKYDNTNPFEVEVYKEINGVKELVSLLEGPEGIKNFTWELKGRVFDYNSKDSWLKSNDLIESRTQPKDIKANQRVFKPAELYSGRCVTNAVICSCSAGTIHIPVHMLLNKYGLAHLNDWDGNSIQLNEEGGFILSPQMGAGHKENDNSFTGVLMGEVQHPNKIFTDVGLFGYNKGIQTIKIDATNGSALFGPTAGQIVIDPTANKAMLYSHDYWLRYNEHGLPETYDLKKNKSNQGMLIDLTTPMIDFGNGNFSVDKDGKLVARNGIFKEGCSFQGEINTLKSARIGQNLYLDYDADNQSYSTIALGDVAHIDNSPRVRFCDFNVNTKGITYNNKYLELDIGEGTPAMSISGYKDTNGVFIRGISLRGSKEDTISLYISNGSLDNWQTPSRLDIKKDKIEMQANKIYIYGYDDKNNQPRNGFGKTGTFEVHSAITTVNGLVTDVR